MYKYFSTLLFLICITACSEDKTSLPTPEALPVPTTESVSYHDDIRPIIEIKCLACHGCFDAPCQLKMENTAGLMRGAHPLEVYDGGRTEAQAPTRLTIDADNEAEWRELGFLSVLKAGQQEKSLLENMLALGKTYSLAANSKIPDDIVLGVSRDNQCVGNNEFSDYAEKHPLEGMPLAVSGLTDNEYALMTGWLQQGAEIDTREHSLNPTEQENITDWELFLNQDSNKQQLLSRWLYEHLFLAHLFFDTSGAPQRFFEMVRSFSPPGQPINIVKTRLPNNDPQAKIYYRLRPVDGSIVHKRHIILPFGETVRKRIKTLFLKPDYVVETLPDYSYEARANPFITFKALPAKARYQFMLDHAEYFTRSFIRGPVCRGQIATDVIRDHFWLIYQDPDHDLFVMDESYQQSILPLLGLPGQDDSLLETGANWDKYKNKRNDYHAKRSAAYREKAPQWASIDGIWAGEGYNHNALLTIFRHSDNASVQKGLIGRVPETVWMMDYPLLERSYYELVVNFDVFGNVAHQLQTRLYFDLIRNGAEHNFLRLLPHTQRKEILENWYDGMGMLKTHVTYAPLDEITPTAINYATDSPKDELALLLLSRFKNINTLPEDKLNRCNDEKCFRPEQASWLQQADQTLSTLTSIDAKQLPGILQLPEVSFLRVSNQQGERTVYSIVRNRAHSNVAFIFGESLRRQPEQDYLTVFPGITGSYPNFIFDVPAEQLAEFSRKLSRAESVKAFESIVVQWGVRRTHPDFWQILHDFSAWHAEQAPLEAGIFDVNRYENL